MEGKLGGISPVYCLYDMICKDTEWYRAITSINSISVHSSVHPREEKVVVVLLPFEGGKGGGGPKLNAMYKYTRETSNLCKMLCMPVCPLDKTVSSLSAPRITCAEESLACEKRSFVDFKNTRTDQITKGKYAESNVNSRCFNFYLKWVIHLVLVSFSFFLRPTFFHG